MTPSNTGSRLKSILVQLGIRGQPGCNCDEHAEEMDLKGVDWCQENMEKIVSWMRNEAKKRNLPFAESFARALVRIAIMKSRKQ